MAHRAVTKPIPSVQPIQPKVTAIKLANALAAVKFGNRSAEPTASLLTPSPPSTPSTENHKPRSLPHRIAHKPKNHCATAVSKQNKRIHKRSASSHTSPTISSEAKRPMYDLEVFLTPPSNAAPEEVEELTDHVQTIVQTITNWNADSILNKIYTTQRFHTNVCPMPTRSFDNFDCHERFVYFFIVLKQRIKLDECHTIPCNRFRV